jgi:plasmid stabilization system protein ParE
LIELRWSVQSETDMLELIAHYDAIDRDLAARIEAAIAAAPRLLTDYPLAGPDIGLGLRKWPVKGTPLLLLYRVAPGWIEVARVVHERQNWRGG